MAISFQGRLDTSVADQESHGKLEQGHARQHRPDPPHVNPRGGTLPIRVPAKPAATVTPTLQAGE